LITLGKMIARAAFIEGYDVKMSELHGLSQRGGSVSVQVRFGKKVYSPLISKADLIISMERNEALKNCSLADKETVFLINDHSIFSPSFQDKKLPDLKEIKKEISRFSKGIYIEQATQKMIEQLKNPILAGVYLISKSIHMGLIPLKPESFLRAIEDLAPKHIDLNKKAFQIAKNEVK